MPMTPSSNSLSMSVRGIRRALVHLADERPDFAVGELVHAVAEEPFVLGQRGQRGLRHGTDVSTGLMLRQQFVTAVAQANRLR